MSRVVECIKCFCGCNELSKDRIKELLCKKIHGFLNDNEAVTMFKKFIPSDSRTHKHIDIVARAKLYQQAEIDTDSDDWEEFVEDLEEQFEDELKESSETNAVLEKIIFYYSKKIETSTDYQNYTDNLKQKYKKIRSPRSR
ncbi:uncharacterized protein LOC128743222 [Sabethes cyaneus]|uniref:uncharacterized protein LOC128743222 n=1 Tax=Sabethes cyaneus TaxID=53552 RepID=UPI00221E2C02|nr:uncharacterized protein LOC128743222 [Sabethes cyaneus]XP_053695745.1 uncharacterized protein LOC128743222 [Sabethes cyaneus]XP_053695753.1 uncharacterized protein LOC128743222 [Sabethes cyaneus]